MLGSFRRQCEKFIEKRNDSAPLDEDDYAFFNSGYSIYTGLFEDVKTREFLREIIDDNNRQNKMNKLTIFSEKLVIPWNFVCLRDPTSLNFLDEGLDSLLGVSCSIVINNQRINKNISYRKPEFPGKVNILAGFYDKLKYAKDFEIPLLKRHGTSHHSRYVNRCDEFPSLKRRGNKENIESDKIAREILFDSDSNIIHFACHGRIGRDRSDSYILVNDNYRLRYSVLYGGEELFHADPVVFINACEISFSNPLQLFHFARELINKNACTVIAPIIRVDDKRSAIFAKNFYSSFLLKGFTALEALQYARQKALSANDYTGFAYSLYGQPNTGLNN